MFWDYRVVSYYDEIDSVRRFELRVVTCDGGVTTGTETVSMTGNSAADLREIVEGLQEALKKPTIYFEKGDPYP